MSSSTVLQEAICAFESAILHPAKQPILAAQRSDHTGLFNDVCHALNVAVEAGESNIACSVGTIDKQVPTSLSGCLGWLYRRPPAVLWPIMEHHEHPKKVSAARRHLVVMVPMAAPPTLMAGPRNVAAALMDRVWSGVPMHPMGNAAALFIAISAGEEGTWRILPVAAWAAHNDSTIEVRPLPLMADCVAQRAITLRCSMIEASVAMMREGVLNVLSMLGER